MEPVTVRLEGAPDVTNEVVVRSFSLRRPAEQDGAREVVGRGETRRASRQSTQGESE